MICVRCGRVGSETFSRWAEELVGDYGDGAEPGFDEGGPVGDGLRRWAEAEGVAAVGKDMQFGGDAGFFEGDEIDEGIVDAVDRVIFGLEDEGWRRVAGGVDIWIEFEFSFIKPEMARV